LKKTWHQIFNEQILNQISQEIWKNFKQNCDDGFTDEEYTLIKMYYQTRQIYKTS